MYLYDYGGFWLILGTGQYRYGRLGLWSGHLTGSVKYIILILNIVLVIYIGRALLFLTVIYVLDNDLEVPDWL